MVRLQEWRESHENLWENRAKICDAKKKSERKKRLAPLRRHFPSPFLPGLEPHSSTRALDARATDSGQREALVRLKGRTT